MKHSDCGTAAVKDNKCLVTAYAYDKETPLLVSLAGTKQTVAAIRAAFALGHQVAAKLNGRAVKWSPISAMYETVTTTMVLQVNQQHTIIAHSSLRGQMVGDTLYVILDDDPTDIARAVMERVKPFALIPMFDAWIPYLWDHGRENKLITALTCSGVLAYKIKLDDTWGQIIEIGFEQDKLRSLRECVGLETGSQSLPKRSYLNAETGK